MGKAIGRLTRTTIVPFAIGLSLSACTVIFVTAEPPPPMPPSGNVPSAPYVAEPPPPMSLPSIHVISATYGAACSAPWGNATANVATECDGRPQCSYLVNNRNGDPAFGCGKDFVAQYRCGNEPIVRQVGHPRRGGEGYAVVLTCGPLGVPY